jgi:hypothetical protein
MLGLCWEDFVLAETLHENGGDFRKEISLFAGKRKGNAEAFGTHMLDLAFVECLCGYKKGYTTVRERNSNGLLVGYGNSHPRADQNLLLQVG